MLVGKGPHPRLLSRTTREKCVFGEDSVGRRGRRDRGCCGCPGEAWVSVDRVKVRVGGGGRHRESSDGRGLQQ